MSIRKENESASQNHQQTGHEQLDPSHQGSAAANGEVAHEDVASLAYELWETRGCPDGSPDRDWFNATQQLHFLE